MTNQTSPQQPTRGRALVIHESMFGNTAAVADAVGGALHQAGFTVDVVPISAAPPAAKLDVDLVLLGAPTHALSLSRPTTRQDAVRQGASAERATTGLREWLADARNHPPTNTTAAAVFDTRAAGARHRPGSAARKAARLAKSAGFRPVHPTHSSYVQDISGPLLDGELDRARAWASEVAAAVLTHSTA